MTHVNKQNQRRILVLDDDAYRHRTYAKLYDGDEVIHTWTYSEFAVSFVNGSPWDIVHLDHDLGDLVTTPDTWVDGWGHRRLRTGRDAAGVITAVPDDKLPRKVIVHSVNPVGARAIVSDLKARGIPVSWEPFRA